MGDSTSDENDNVNVIPVSIASYRASSFCSSSSTHPFVNNYNDPNNVSQIKTRTEAIPTIVNYDNNNENNVSNGPIFLVTSRRSMISAGEPLSSMPSNTIIYDDEMTKSDTEANQEANEPPDGGYGWIVVFCSFVFNFTSFGSNASYGTFLNYYLSHDAFPDSTSLDFAFIAGLSTGTCLIIAPLTSILIRRIGYRITIILGMLIQFASFMGASFATKVWQLYLSQGVGSSIGLGLIFFPPIAIIPQWFSSKRRSLANGIASAGSGAGGLVYNLSVNAMIKRTGSTHWGLRMMAIINICLNIVGVILVRSRTTFLDPNAQKVQIVDKKEENISPTSQQKIFDFDVFRIVPLRFVCIWVGFNIIGFCVFQFSLAAYATSVGLSPDQGSAVLALLSAAQIIGRPAVGFLSDRFGRVNVTMCITTILGILCFTFWIPATTFSSLAAYGFINGCMVGTIWVNYPPMIADVAELKILSSALSVASVFVGVPGIFSEVIAIKLRRTDETGGAVFRYVQILIGLIYIVSVCVLSFLREWKIHRFLKGHVVYLNERKQLLTSCDYSIIKEETVFLNSQRSRFRFFLKESMIKLNHKVKGNINIQSNEKKLKNNSTIKNEIENNFVSIENSTEMRDMDVEISNIEKEIIFVNSHYLQKSIKSFFRRMFFISKV